MKFSYYDKINFMNIVFMGTPEFAADILSYIIQYSRHNVVEVITKPDQIRTRGNKKTESPVKKVAVKNNIPVFDCDINNNSELKKELITLKPDVICVVAFGKILDKEILDIPKYCCVNVHGSRLPEYRGPAPFQWSILDGRNRAYVCIMKMDEGMDTGQYAGTTSVSIGDKYLYDIVKEISHPAFLELDHVLNEIEEGQIKWHDQVNLPCPPSAPKLGKQYLYLTYVDSAENAKRKVRASDSSHPVKCIISGRNVTILKATLPKDRVEINKYEVSLIDNKLYIGMDDGALEIEEIKPDGKNSMDGKSFALGIQNGDYTWKELH